MTPFEMLTGLFLTENASEDNQFSSNITPKMYVDKDTKEITTEGGFRSFISELSGSFVLILTYMMIANRR